MSALGQKQTCPVHQAMSALTPKADMCSALAHVCFGPIAEHSGVQAPAKRNTPITAAWSRNFGARKCISPDDYLTQRVSGTARLSGQFIIPVKEFVNLPL
jgi:hypothetical protein